MARGRGGGGRAGAGWEAVLGGPLRRRLHPRSLRHPWTLACHPPGRVPCPLRRPLASALSWQAHSPPASGLLFPLWNAPRHPLAAALALLFLRGLPRRLGSCWELGGGVSAGGCRPPPRQAWRPVRSADPREGTGRRLTGRPASLTGPEELRGEDEVPGAAHGLERLKQEGDEMGACVGWGGLR